MYADYTTLKGKSKVAIKKIAATDDINEHFVFERKTYNGSTGEAQGISVSNVTLIDLETEKNSLTSEKTRIESELTSIEAMITDIKAL